MCTGACILYKVKRVVIGENATFLGGEEYLKQRGVEVIVLQNTECRQLMEEFIKAKPELWYVTLIDSLLLSESASCLTVQEQERRHRSLDI